MPRVVHFEINADDPERAATFYQNIFGWNIKKWEGPIDYWLVETGAADQPGGINGGITRRMGPAVTTVSVVDVPNVDDYVRKVEAAGGKVVTPKEKVPGVGDLAYCSDTEGNVFGIIQPEPM